MRSLAVGLLNLSGLGLGYALMGRWYRAALCWAATGGLLLAALPAEPDGVPAGIVVSFLVVLVLTAADGAWTARRSAVGGSWRPLVAAALGLVLLGVPAGGAVVYGSERDEAVQQMLLDRLEKGDRAVAAAAKQSSFAGGRVKYRTALDIYRELGEDHSGSRAGKLVPSRLKAYYKAVSAPYEAKDHCQAVEPLTHLRTVPDSVDAKLLGSLAAWPDEPLAESLYGCGVSKIGDGSDTNDASDGGELGELLRTLPDSAQAKQVGPAVTGKMDEQVKAVRGGEPCAATEVLRRIGATVAAMPDRTVAALSAKADDGVQDGVYACGVDEFKDKKFTEARETLSGFADTYKKDGRRQHARDIVIAAEIAEDRPSAGKRLPPRQGPGGPRMELVLSNDAPNAVEILYTGPVSGSVELKGCGSCKRYSASDGPKLACRASGKRYPKVTLRLPAGEYHFLYKHGTGASADVDSYASGSRVQSGYTYTSCTYVTTESDAAPGLDLPSIPDAIKPASTG
ncbi:hypothetical protein F0344_10275 [Streptomyces finlayi]|uniref:Uncharacterized protein n=1 Tax=Streptomyces finlayi TaxID=67296 RepID=A0A7G7BUZ3_9ACTN|nr:hypothetical protein F0344_10275 [Streptomyces finlayi]